MSFDVTDAADLLALKNEVNLDPAGVGYSGVVEGGKEFLALLNDAVNNPAPDTGIDFLLADDLMEMLFSENISAGDQFRVQLLFEMTASPQDSFDRYRAQISALDNGLAIAIAAHIRDFSRAEFLFSDVVDGANESVTISSSDWVAARNS